MKVCVIYFSSSGKTAEMAKLLGEQIRQRDHRVLVTSLDEARRSDLAEAAVILVGSPAWSGERVVEPMIDFLLSNLDAIRGKRVAFFGSYDWGDGLYFDSLAETLHREGADVHEMPLVIQSGDAARPEDARVFLDGALAVRSAAPPGGR